MAKPPPKKLGADPLARPRGLAWIAPQPPPEPPTSPAPEPAAERPPSPAPPATPAARPRRARSSRAEGPPAPPVSTSHAGLPPGYKRHTFILPEDVLRRLRRVAFDAERPIKDVVEEALRAYLDAR